MDKPKCIICGNKLELTGEAEVVCKYCETKQKVPEKYRKIIDNNNNNCNDERNEKIYQEAVSLIKKASTYADYMQIVSLLKPISGYKNSSRLIEQCTVKADSYDNDNIYCIGKSLMNGGRREDYEKALTEFLKIPGWKDTRMLIQICHKRISEIDSGKKSDKKKIVFIIVLIIALIAVSGYFVVSYFIPNSRYNKAMSLFANEMYSEAESEFDALGEFKDSEQMAEKSRERISDNKESETAEEEEETGELKRVSKVYRCNNKKSPNYYSSRYAIGTIHALGLSEDGEILVVGDNNKGQCNILSWNNIIGISAGNYNTVGLKDDGTVVATGLNDDGQCEVSDWTGIMDIATGYSFTLGLKKDGTVCGAGKLIWYEDALEWEDIVTISVGFTHAVGLKSDGTVVASGSDLEGEGEVYSWEDIVDVSAGCDYTVGLKSDGTVVATGDNSYGRCNVSGWADIVDISAGEHMTAGLKSDGTVVVASSDSSVKRITEEVAEWTDIVSIDAGYGYDLTALKSDGTLLTTGDFEVEDWEL